MRTQQIIHGTLAVGLVMMVGATSVWGDPVGVVGVDKTNTLARSMGLSVCQIEVVFDSSSDKLLSIGFSDILTNSPIGFYQNSYGDDLPPNSAFCTLFPALCLDSFVTIGVGTEGGGSDSSAVDADWNSSLFNTGGATAGGWFNANPENSQGVPNANLHVLIAQLTIRRGYGIEGDVTIYHNDGTVGFPASFQCYGGVPGDGPSGPMSGPEESESGAPLGGSGCCGDPFSGNCFDPAGSVTPCCNCAPCCEVVCAADPFCCEQQWDYLCISAALAGCDPAWCAGAFDEPAQAGEAGTSSPESTGCTIHVDRDATGSPHDGSSWCQAFLTLQDALYEAAEGDIICVADGTYTPVSRSDLFQIISGTTLQGGYAGCSDPGAPRNVNGYETILSCDLNGDDGPNFTHYEDNCHHVVDTSAAGATTIIDGFTIRGGDAASAPPEGTSGGGILNEGGSPTISQCKIIENKAVVGGGVYHHAGLAVLTDCVIQSNHASSEGGGIAANSQIILDRCTLSGNHADLLGGGLYNRINVPSDPPGLSGEGPVQAVNCIFSGNTAEKGGGFYGGDLEQTFLNCLFFENEATLLGGGIHTDRWTTDPLTSIINCTFSDNQTTGQGSQGGGIYVSTDADTTLMGTILWGNSAMTSILDAQITGAPIVRHSDIQDDDGPGGDVPFGGMSNGNIDIDPQFIDSANGNYRLSGGPPPQSPSPCIDAADNAPLIALGVTTDLDDKPRFVDDPDATDCPYLPNSCGSGFIADMGPYEFQGCPACVGDFDESGVVNAADLALLLGAWGAPGCGGDLPCCQDITGNGSVNAADLAQLLGNWGPC